MDMFHSVRSILVSGFRVIFRNVSVVVVLWFSTSVAFASSHYAGTTPGKFDVSPSGAATYTVPIEVPPGISGMQPELALVYNSNSGNGELGVGWSLSGLSKIERCPTTLAQDGFVDGVDFDDNDQFCLDGQRLVAINGVYGADGTEYRTEIETYSKIISNGTVGSGPVSFTVWTKSGQKIEYGATDDSRIEAQGRIDVLTWAVSKKTDFSGNYISYEYTEDSINGEYEIARISYSGTINSQEFASIRFSYSTGRNDYSTKYIYGSKQSTMKLMSGIGTYVNETNVKNYNIEYIPQTLESLSRINSISECDSTQKCKLPTILNWSAPVDDSYTGTWCTGYVDIDPDKCKSILPIDLNNDGRSDYACAYDLGTTMRIYGWISTETGMTNGTWYTGVVNIDLDQCKSITPLDLNGDGLTDLSCAYDMGTTSRIYGWISTGEGMTNGTWYTGVVNIDLDQCKSITPLDLNGDGLTDLSCAYDMGTTSRIYGWISTETGMTDGTWYTGVVNIDLDQCKDISAMDLNGDGLVDLSCAYDQGTTTRIYGWISTGAGMTNGTWYTGVVNIDLDQCKSITPLDLNGDGLTDLSCAYDMGTTSRIYGWISTGERMTNGTWYTGVVNIDLDQCKNISTMDLNGDGLVDLSCAYDQGTTTRIYGWISTGRGMTNGTWYTGVVNIDLEQCKSITPLDLNGDGLDDESCAYDFGSNMRIYAWHKSDETYPNLLKSIENGYGTKISVNYKPTSDTSIYTKTTGADFPVNDIQNSMHVVSSYSKNNGVNGVYSYSYIYEGARINLQDLGFLGFAKVTLTDDQTGIVTETTYNQTFPTDGLVSSKKISLGNVDLVIENYTNDWENPGGTKTVDVGKRYVVNQTGKSQQKKDIKGILLSNSNTSITYDDYGNPINIVKAYSDGYRKEVTNTYNFPDTQNWNISELICSTTKSDTPLGDTATRRVGFAYDAKDRISKQVIEPDAADSTCTLPTALSVVTDYLYDDYGNKTSITTSGADIATRQTTNTYDYSQLENTTNPQFSITTTNALGHSETKVFDARFGVITSLTGPNGLPTTWSYDGLGRKTGEFHADGTSIGIEYLICEPGTTCADATQQSLGSPLAIRTTHSTVLGADRQQTLYMDILGREVKKTVNGFSGNLVSMDSQYDIYGNLHKVSNPYFGASASYWTVFDHDLLGRLIAKTGPDGSVTSTSYDGLVITTTNDKSQVNVKEMDSQGQLIRSTDDNLASNTYTYWPFGKLKSVTDNAGNVTSMTYDDRGRKLTIDAPDLGLWEYKYDVIGNLTWQKDPKGQIVTNTYDVLNRRTARTEPEGTTSWTYDDPAVPMSKGKLTKVVSPGAYQRTYAYESLAGRLATITTSIGTDTYSQSIAYESGTGRVSTIAYSGNGTISGLTVKNVYDPASGMLSEVRNGINDTLIWKAVALNASNQLVEELLGNNVTIKRAYTDATGRLSAIQSGLNQGVNAQNLVYGFDTLGNLETRTDFNQGGLTESFTYDNLNRLKTATIAGIGSRSYSYDSIGNITSKSDLAPGDYVYGQNGAGPHAVTSAGGLSYTYDLNGNMTGGDGRSISYTSFNKPLTISKPGINNSYEYDADHQRDKKISVINGVTTTTLYIDKSFEVVHKPSGISEHRYYIKTGSATYLYTARSDASSEEKYLLKDHLGSTDVITDKNGVVTERLSYMPFGKRRTSDWAYNSGDVTSAIIRGFTGHEMEDELGLINMNARLYDPKLGRFIQADPIVQFPDSTQGLNRYSYTDNNPTSRIDLTGHGWGGAITGTIAGFALGGGGGALTGLVVGTIVGEYNDNVEQTGRRAGRRIKEQAKEKWDSFSDRARKFLLKGGWDDAISGHWEKNKWTYAMFLVDGLNPVTLSTKKARTFFAKYKWAEYAGATGASGGGPVGSALWSTYMAWAKGEEDPKKLARTFVLSYLKAKALEIAGEHNYLPKNEATQSKLVFLGKVAFNALIGEGIDRNFGDGENNSNKPIESHINSMVYTTYNRYEINSVRNIYSNYDRIILGTNIPANNENDLMDAFVIYKN